MLDQVPVSEAPELLLSVEHSSDAGVYKLSESQALVQSVDFFTPIVDDPFTFGRIAAANALSDVYAMGGRPITAMALVCFPHKLLGPEVLAQILRGGVETVHAAGAVVVGGHSVRDPELKYGLAVTGLVDPRVMRTNQAARPGEALILTKALGTGYVANAVKGGALTEDDPRVAEVVESMATLNKTASEVLERFDCRCATDVTGFGLLGHAKEMAGGSGVALQLDLAALPCFEVALELAASKPLAGGQKDNFVNTSPVVDAAEGADEARLRLAYDAQTSGGLLATLPAERADEAVAALRAAGVTVAARIGEVLAGPAGRVLVS